MPRRVASGGARPSAMPRCGSKRRATTRFRSGISARRSGWKPMRYGAHCAAWGSRGVRLAPARTFALHSRAARLFLAVRMRQRDVLDAVVFRRSDRRRIVRLVHADVDLGRPRLAERRARALAVYAWPQ